MKKLTGLTVARLSLGLVMAAAIESAAATALTLYPNYIGGGNIPAIGLDIHFKLHDSSYTKDITLPAVAADNRIITISSTATHKSVIHTDNVDTPFIRGILIADGDDSISFQYSATAQQWQPTVFTVTQLQAKHLKDGTPDLTTRHTRIHYSNGNWRPTVPLPTGPTGARDLDQLLIESNASKLTRIKTHNIDTRFHGDLVVAKGQSLLLQYNAPSQNWSILKPPTEVVELTAADLKYGAPELSAQYAHILYTDASWRATVPLPATAPKGAQLLVESNASKATRIDTTQMLFSEAVYRLQQGDYYLLQYDSKKAKWVLVNTPESTPINKWRAQDVVQGIPQLTYPRAEVYLSAGNWVRELTLPATANDRERLKIKSDAPDVAFIDNKNCQFQGSMTLHAGEQYEFVYDALLAKWALIDSPSRAYNASDLAAAEGQLPDTVVPATYVTFGESNWIETLTLPQLAKPGDKVHVTSASAQSFAVTAAAAAFPKPFRINQGETHTFTRQAHASGDTWQLDTTLISVLWLYSKPAKDALGASGIQARIVESLHLAQEALRNIAANFRLKVVHTAEWTPADEADIYAGLHAVTRDPSVKALRDQHRADFVFYSSAAPRNGSCGWAHLNTSLNPIWAYGNEQIGCPTTIFRHEIGHMLGLGHDQSGRTPYARGYKYVKTIMDGNSIPYYSTPSRYTQHYQLNMGITDQYDAARAMNEISAKAAQFYE